jgi:drug/metabolite transporter (DMT)-like permease
MTPADLISYLLAAIAALGNAVANVTQRKASLQQPDADSFNARYLLGLVRDRTWIIGFGGMVVAFGFQAAALAVGQLSAVEPVITLEVPLTLLLASRVLGSRLRRQDWTSILVMTGGMIALIAALAPGPGQETAVNSGLYLVAGGGTVATIAALIALAIRENTFWRTACMGAAAGTSFGLTATLMKAAIVELTDHGVAAMLTNWQVYAAIFAGMTGVLLMQWALQSGPLVAAQPGFTLMDPLVSILWGVLVYDETTRTGGWLVLATIGGIALGVGVVLLARSPAARSSLPEEANYPAARPATHLG